MQNFSFHFHLCIVPQVYYKPGHFASPKAFRRQKLQLYLQQCIVDKPMETKDQEKERLLRRKNEILEQLARLRGEMKEELDPDPEEQAIQMETTDVNVAIAEQLHKELMEIDGRLLELA
jgi:predicted transcriptional regulator